MDCLEDGDDVYNLLKCNVDEEDEADIQINDEDIKDDMTLHGCDIHDDPSPMAERGEETLQGKKDGDDVDNMQRGNEDEDIGEYVHANDTDVIDDVIVYGCDINHDPKPMAKTGEENLQGCDYDNDIRILESWNEDQSNVGGNAAGKLAESVVAHENETKYGAVNESEQIQEQSDNGDSIRSHDTVPIYARVLEEESNIYCDGYTVQLPKTEDGFMINLIGTNTGVPFMEEYICGIWWLRKTQERAKGHCGRNGCVP